MKEDLKHLSQITKADYVWSIFVILISSGLLSSLSLNFAIGVNSWEIYIGYFTHPLIFLLNWLPVFLVQVLLFSCVNRHWLAFSLNCVVTLIPALGNFFKLKFRNDPFSFSDISSITAGLSIAKNYNIQLNTRIVVCLISVLIVTLALYFLIHIRVGKRFRLISILLIASSTWPLWHFIYSNDILYNRLAASNHLDITMDSREKYIETGFPYPFLHSINASSETPPSGYSESTAIALLNEYSDQEIPSDRKVNLLFIQLESFSDLEAMGISGINSDVYACLRELQSESLYGTMIANVIGGGTITTERCILAGTTKMLEYNQPAWSYVRYLKGQGYKCNGSHPYLHFFYSRSSVMTHLGFDSFLFSDYFAPIIGDNWRCDETYLPEVFRIFLENIEEAAPVFSFNITLQGHGPYNDEGYDVSGQFWSGNGVSDRTNYLLNNYLSNIPETLTVVKNELQKIRSYKEPIVVVLYGDHKPWFGDEVYNELGISFAPSTEDGLADYRGTPYLIWANDAAKTALANNFTGELPTTSPGYLMNILFEEFGWEGPSFMQCTSEIRSHLPLIYLGGYYIEDGTYTHSLSSNGNTMLRNYEYLQYYIHYRP